MSGIPPELAAALGQRYQVRRVLGRGGMATVYLARDRKHDRDVALKVLRPDLAASLGAERFLAEIQIAARLTHPRILALHDSGEAGGFLYYVMPYIHGPTLRQQLERRGPSSLAEALDVAAAVADALVYAHRQGVLHRDIKPENILLAEGYAIVADFGIAKAVSTAGGVNLTRTGFPLGTPGYMSPEQAAGLTDLDGRSDVFSLAVTTYEMLLGELPGCWPTEDSVRQGRFLEAPATHRARLRDLGGTAEGALVRGMAVRLDQRTPTPRALVDQLAGRAAAKRRYSEQEVQEIVQRAADLEASTPTASGSMTIGGVEEIARDVGIPTDMVRSAAASLSPARGTGGRAAPPQSHPLAGGPIRLLFERVVEGEVPEAEFPLLVEEIRHTTQQVGQVSKLGRSFSWSAARGARQRDLEVAVTVRAGKTRISVHENLVQLLGATFGGIGGGVGGGGLGPIVAILVGGVHLPGALAAVIPLWLGMTYGIARTSYRYSTKRRAEHLERLADRLEELARDLVAESRRLPPSDTALPT